MYSIDSIHKKKKERKKNLYNVISFYQSQFYVYQRSTHGRTALCFFFFFLLDNLYNSSRMFYRTISYTYTLFLIQYVEEKKSFIFKTSLNFNFFIFHKIAFKQQHYYDALVCVLFYICIGVLLKVYIFRKIQ